MKTLKIHLVLAVLALVALAGLLYASSANHYSGTGTSITGLEYAVVPGKGGMVAKINYLRYANGSDLAAGVNIRDCAVGTLINANASAAATNILNVASGGTAYATNDVIVIYDVSAAAYERALVHTSTATSVTLSTATTMVPAAGDVIYEATTVATLPLGVGTTNELSVSQGFFNGTDGRPVLVDVVSTNGPNLFLISADYVQP